MLAFRSFVALHAFEKESQGAGGIEFYEGTQRSLNA